MLRVFLNTKSGSRDFKQEQIRALLPGCTVTKLTRAEDLERLSAQDGAHVAWIAAGGDGTVNAIANIVATTGRPMGVFPCGTHNHFARDLGMPLDPAAAAAVLLAGHTRFMDAAEVNGRVFVNNASLGAYPAMVLDRNRQESSGRSRWAALVFASLRAFVRFRCLRLELLLDGRQRTCTTPFLFVGNNEYCLDGLRLGRRDRLDQATLALYLAPGVSREGILRMVLSASLGRLKQDPEYEELLTPAFTVHLPGRRLRVSLDGEVIRLFGPLHFRTLPAALQVLCPASQQP